MNNKEMKVKVMNVTEGEEDFVVARPYDGELWYYGRYSTSSKAEEVAEEVEGIVCIDEEHEITMPDEEPKIEVHCPRCGKVLTEFDQFMNWCPMCMLSIKERDNG